jgi:hypothetical protein
VSSEFKKFFKNFETFFAKILKINRIFIKRKTLFCYLPEPGNDGIVDAFPDLPQLVADEEEARHGVGGHEGGDEPVRPLFQQITFIIFETNFFFKFKL